MSEAAAKVLEGRISEMLLNYFDGWDLVRAGIPRVQFSQNSTHSDEWDNTLPREEPSVWDETVCTDHALQVEYGIEQEKLLKIFITIF